MTDIEFKSFPKIERFKGAYMVITQKIHGSNGQIYIQGDEIYAGSRNRWVTPQDDNYGFASWVQANKEELKKLGHGRHYGEWAGPGINAGEGLTEKKFLLFNHHRPPDTLPAGVDLVPILYKEHF